MKSDLRFEFIVSKNNHTITVRREFNAKRQLVWDCHSKSELLDQWFAPKPLTAKTKHMDFREGGYWHFVMVTPEGEEFWNRLDYETIRPIDCYTVRDAFCDETGAINPDMPEAKWDVTFSDVHDRTLVTTVLQYASSDALQKVIDMGLKDGLTSAMERLDELLVVLNPS